MELLFWIFLVLFILGVGMHAAMYSGSPDPRDADHVLLGSDRHHLVFEHTERKVPPGRSGRRKRERIINRMTQDGWEFMGVRAGGLFGSDLASFRRPRV